ncbi:MAG: hypothetical protein QG553_292 [Patescibacteria group bacterium]|nr:hypothetical protein [Patescibacteria group bacterium]
MDNQQNIPQQTQVDQNTNLAQPQEPKRKNKKIVLVSLIVVLALVAFGGLYYWQNSKNQDLQKQLDASKAEVTKLQQQSKAEETTDTAAPETTKAPDSSNAGFLVIPEYGVKIKLSDADKVTYTITGTPGGAGNADSVQSYATIDLKNNTQGSKCATVGLSITQRTTGSGTKIGTSYYGFDGGEPQACGNSQEDALRTKIYNELLAAQIVAK